jgi:hypothetical protein
MLEAAANGRAPFEKADLFLFGERDAEQLDWQYIRPDYWLYFPTDKRTPFLGAEPECRHDYLTGFFAGLISRWPVSEGVSRAEFPRKARPGSKITVTLKLKRTVLAKSVSLSFDGKTFTPASFNCIRNLAIGELQLPDQAVTGEISALVSLDRGHEIKLGLGSVEVSHAAGGNSTPAVPRPQPSIERVLSQFPNLRIEQLRLTGNAWDGFVLIDLRTVNRHGIRLSEE